MRAALLVTGLACGGSGIACGNGIADDALFSVEPYGIPECDRVDNRLAGDRELRLYLHGRVDLVATTRGLQRYYRRHGLRFFTTAPPERIDLGFALDTDVAELNRALEAAFPGVDLDDPDGLMRDPVLYDRIVKYTLNHMLRPVLEFARHHSAQGTAVTNLVLLSQLQRPGGNNLFPGERLAGLAVSPALVKRLSMDDSPEAALWRAAELPLRFTPLIFLDEGTLAQLSASAPALRGLIAAHELGHTGGLVHTTVPGNLMTPGHDDCKDALTDEQVSTMADSLGLSPIAPPSPEGPTPVVVARGRPEWLPPWRFVALLDGDDGALGVLLRPLQDHHLPHSR